MTAHEANENRYKLIVDMELGESEEARRSAAVQKTYSLVRQWRSRFTDESIEPKPYPADEPQVLLSSQSETHVFAEEKVSDELRRTHELSGEEGNLVVMEHPKDGEPREVVGDFVSHHDYLARIVFDCDNRVRRG